MDIEWPPGSGRIAHYDDYEIDVMRDLIQNGGSAGEIMLIHDFKATLDARIIDPARKEAQMRGGVCPECEVGGGYHTADCPIGGDNVPKLPGIVGEATENLFQPPEELAARPDDVHANPSDNPFPDDMTVGQARMLLRAFAEDKGHDCPVCSQFSKIQKRTINSGMAHSLVVFWRTCGQEWGDKRVVLRGVGAAARDESLLRFWGLFEESPDRTGWWRVTVQGERFVRGEITVPKYAYTYDRGCLDVSGPPVGIREALGDAFDLDELMARTAHDMRQTA